MARKSQRARSRGKTSQISKKGDGRHGQTGLQIGSSSRSTAGRIGTIGAGANLGDTQSVMCIYNGRYDYLVSIDDSNLINFKIH